jgi:hypothetical protein
MENLMPTDHHFEDFIPVYTTFFKGRRARRPLSFSIPIHRRHGSEARDQEE